MTRIVLQAIVSKTAVFTGSGVAVDTAKGADNTLGVATLVVHVQSLDSSQTARIEVRDSVDAFSNSVAVTVVHVQGGIDKTNDLMVRIPWYDIPDARFGVASSTMRVDVTSISGGTLVYESWVEF